MIERWEPNFVWVDLRATEFSGQARINDLGSTKLIRVVLANRSSSLVNKQNRHALMPPTVIQISRVRKNVEKDPPFGSAVVTGRGNAMKRKVDWIEE